MRTIILLLSGLFCFSAVSTPLHHSKIKPTITWAKWDDPPIFILSGKFKGQGTLDLVEEDLKRSLTKYRHENLEANVRRVIQLAKEKAETCNAGWLNTKEWNELFILSNPIFKLPTNGIIIKEKKLKEINFKSKTSLQAMIKKRKLRMAIGRLYGEGIDDYLKSINYQKHPQIDVVASSYLAHQMLQIDRVDYTIGYPTEANYYRIIHEGSEKIIYIPVTDNSDYVDVVVACSKTQQGRAIIDDINKKLENRGRKERYQQMLNNWLTTDQIERIKIHTATN